MNVKNTKNAYGLVSILLHWTVALGVFFLFALGLWMDNLDYYHEYYQLAPHIHKSVGVILVSLILGRFVWRIVNKQPEALSQVAWQNKLASVVHYLLYLLPLCLFISGYLITTAKGASLEVFTWFHLPSLVQSGDNLEDLAGELHELLAFSLIALVVLHLAAALKHHFINKDSTLTRMLKPEKKND